MAQYRTSSCIVASGTPCEKSETVSFSGQRVALRRRRRSMRSSSGTLNLNGRTKTSVAIVVVTFSSLCARLVVAASATPNSASQPSYEIRDRGPVVATGVDRVPRSLSRGTAARNLGLLLQIRSSHRNRDLRLTDTAISNDASEARRDAAAA